MWTNLADRSWIIILTICIYYQIIDGMALELTLKNKAHRTGKRRRNRTQALLKTKIILLFTPSNKIDRYQPSKQLPTE
jgi:hypothetical protein